MTWNIGAENNLHGKRIFNECIEISRDVCSLLEKSTVVVDCGCGRGGLLSLLKQEGYRNIVGYDYTPDRVQISRDAGLNVFLWDISKFPLWDNAADCVIYEESLEYLEERKYHSSLQEANRILKAGGFLIIASLTFDSVYRGLETGYERCLNKDELLVLLPHFEVVKERWTVRGSKHPCFILILQKVQKENA